MPCRVEFRVHLRKVKWLNNLSIISKNILSIVRVRRVTLHDATLTVSNDQSPYFQSSPLPLPVAPDRPRAAPRPPAR
ncbi:hypothetical protein T01_14163 [Trichinella spiralis]|uniref:Uncharacterized protein n=1 Tax=Trichinella spiralis TaxID=6334 RepID=A0A0V0ZQU2_TRISP|nr:hypothetical protein T01_14163 [Trichinella spiralis]